MEKILTIDGKYICIPVKIGADEVITNIMIDGQKFTELKLPVDKDQKGKYEGDFFAQIPLIGLIGKKITFEGDLTEEFLGGLYCTNDKYKDDSSHPIIHFTADSGWTNDPNGLVYSDGVYHLYFQYNPVNTIWHNMCWGHAVSEDLLHWEQRDIVMLPDEDGEMFSGCGLVNDRRLLELPEDALLFFYTASGGGNEWSKGKEFTQKMAYSLDNGETLVKIKEPCLDTIQYDNRDPKIFWHEESNSYVMVLWIEGQKFGIFRSENLKNWEETDRIFLEGGWECPDLFKLKAPDGSEKWFFWSAQGNYYTGEFDGYKFRLDGIKRNAYVNEVPYAAQTYSGLEDRIVSIPWIRLENDGRFFTGACGIPVEFSCDMDYNLVQCPVRELYNKAKLIGVDNKLYSVKNKALMVKMSKANVAEDIIKWSINGTDVEYSSKDGMLKVGAEEYKTISECDNFMMIIDDRILEIFFNGGQMLGTFDLHGNDVSFETVNAVWEEIETFEII